MNSIKGIINNKEVNSKMNVFQGPQGIPGKDGRDGVTPDLSNYYTKNEINKLIGNVETLLSEV